MTRNGKSVTLNERVFIPQSMGNGPFPAVIAMSLLVSPLWFLLARVFHTTLQNQASRVMGLDLKNFRLWRTALIPFPAPPGPGE